jgi:hypothetical protein
MVRLRLAFKRQKFFGIEKVDLRKNLDRILHKIMTDKLPRFLGTRFK